MNIKQRIWFKAFRWNLLTVIFLLMHSSVQAQEVNIQMSLDTNTILIGEQTQLNISYSLPKNLSNQLPQFKDTLNREIEILNTQIDTLSKPKDDFLKLNYTLTITSFDSGHHVIRPFIIKYNVKNDSIFDLAESNVLLLSVNGIKVDLQGEIKDIKGIIEIPMTFGEIFIRYILPIVGILLLAGLLFFIYLRRKKNIPIFQRPKKPLPPPHVEAMQALTKLETEKLWQNNEIKAYYSRLTDILRRYAERRFDFPAQEMVSNEIIGSLRSHIQDEELLSQMEKHLSVADLVKFAKWQALPDECNAIMKWSKDFVTKTQEQEEVKND